MLSPVLLGIITVIIFLSVMKGRRQGFFRTVIRMARLLTAAFISAFGAILLAELIAEPLFTLLEEGEIITDITETLGSYAEILVLISQMIISSILFIPLFIIVNLIASLIILIVVSVRAKHKNGAYCSENAHYVIKKDRLLGGAFGAVCGLFLSVVILSPLTGTIRSLSDVREIYTVFAGEEAEIPEEFDAVCDYSSDAMVVLNDMLGGGAFYNISTTVFCYGDYTNIRAELKTIKGIDVNSITKLAESVGNLDGETMSLVEDFLNQADNSPFLRYLLYSTVKDMATAWLNGQEFMGISRPDPVDTGAVHTFVNATLRVLSDTDVDRVHMDLVTFVHILEIFAEHEEALTTGDYSKTLEALLSGSLIDQIEHELAINPDMEPVQQALDNVIMQTVSEEILSNNYTISERKELFSQISTALNDTVYLDADQRHKVISEEVLAAFKDYGFDVQEGLPDKITNSLINQVLGSNGNVSVDDLENYFNSFINNR